MRDEGHRVLVVGDDAEGANAWAMVLVLEGHSCRTVVPDEPIDAAIDQWWPDVLLLDVQHVAVDDIAARLASVRDTVAGRVPIALVPPGTSQTQGYEVVATVNRLARWGAARERRDFADALFGGGRSTFAPVWPLPTGTQRRGLAL